MQIRSEYKLRKMGRKYMIVEAGDNVDLANVYTLNEAAALLWQTLADDENATPDMLAQTLADAYNITLEQAHHDVAAQLAQWEEMKLIAR